MLFWSVLLVVVALSVLALGVVLVRSVKQVTRARASLGVAQAGVRDRTGLLRARGAALRLAFARRSRRPAE